MNTDFYEVKSSTIDDMKKLLLDIKNEQKQVKNLERELKEIKKAKKYGLVWEEKEEFFDKETIGKLPVLKEIKDRNIKQNNEENNILIEGDNYHTLSVLNYTHKGKIDAIYIDPPYNTGNEDFIYNDKFVEKENKFRHSLWLSFMNKRLKLAKNLLSEKGVIFISIDDNEFAQLKLLCDGIFGENNFISNIIWKKTENIKMDSNYLSINTEYILCYKKGIIEEFNKKISDINRFNLEDEKGKYYLRKLDSKSSTYSKGMDYIIEYDGLKYYAGGNYQKYLERQTGNNKKKDCTWLWSKNKFEEGLKEGEIIIKNGNIYNKVRFDGLAKKPYISLFDFVSGQTGQKELDTIFNNRIFDHPKPYLLIKELFKLVGNKNSIILDFFAGSGTTGHAVLELNKEDGGNRKFILATNNENNICEEVTYERIKKVMTGYKNSKGEKVEGLGGNLTYLKTDFIDKHNSNDDLRLRMVNRCTELLCLKENIWYELKQKNDKIKIFKRNDKYLAILYDMFYFDEFKSVLKTLDKTVSIYAFSHFKIDSSEFLDLEIPFEIEEIPDPILEVYETIFGI